MQNWLYIPERGVLLPQTQDRETRASRTRTSSCST